MEQNSSKSSRCNSICEKLVKALAGYPDFLRLRKPKPVHKHNAKSSDVVVVKEKKEIVPSYFLQIESHEKNHKGKLEEANIGDGVAKHTGGDINDAFTDYINRAKHKLRSVSSKQQHQQQEHSYDFGNKKKENVKDQQFSDYISRAKKKLRSTSSNVGFIKAISMKKE